MFDFELDYSSYFDFNIDKNMTFVIKQNSELPILEIKPIRTKNFNELVSLIQDAFVSFSMFDKFNCAVILDKTATINTDTENNDYNSQSDTCNDIVDFTLQYKFSKTETKLIGDYKGEFKIVFKSGDEEKVLIVPITNDLNIKIIP